MLSHPQGDGSAAFVAFSGENFCYIWPGLSAVELLCLSFVLGGEDRHFKSLWMINGVLIHPGAKTKLSGLTALLVSKGFMDYMLDRFRKWSRELMGVKY